MLEIIFIKTKNLYIVSCMTAAYNSSLQLLHVLFQVPTAYEDHRNISINGNTTQKTKIT